MLGPVLLDRYRAYFRAASDADRAESLRRLAADYASPKRHRTRKFKHPEVAAIYFEDLARRLDR